jgi:hypothetical protein
MAGNGDRESRCCERRTRTTHRGREEDRDKGMGEIGRQFVACRYKDRATPSINTCSTGPQPSTPFFRLPFTSVHVASASPMLLLYSLAIPDEVMLSLYPNPEIVMFSPPRLSEPTLHLHPCILPRLTLSKPLTLTNRLLPRKLLYPKLPLYPNSNSPPFLVLLSPPSFRVASRLVNSSRTSHNCWLSDKACRS